MFQLTRGEFEILRSQIVTSNSSDNQEDEDWKSQIVISNYAKMGMRKLPYAFTELGVAMLTPAVFCGIKFGSADRAELNSQAHCRGYAVERRDGRNCEAAFQA